MKKSLLIGLVLIMTALFAREGFSQSTQDENGEASSRRVGAARWVIGIGTGMFLSVNDAYGRLDDQTTYGMKTGRGVDLSFKYGLGATKKNRITARVSYIKMINDDKDRFFLAQPFLTSPTPPHSFYDLISGAVGYEYVFGAPCCNKQTVGLAFTINNISAPDYNSFRGQYNSALRMGIELTAGYEFLFGQTGKYGLGLSFKYNQANLFNKSNDALLGNHDLNDGDGPGGQGFARKIGIFSINAAFNIYGGM